MQNFTKQITAGNNRIILHAKNETALQPKEFVNGKLQLLVKNKGRSYLCNVSHFIGHKQHHSNYVYNVTLQSFRKLVR